MKMSYDEAQKLLVGKVIVFNAKVEELEIDFDEGMKAEIVGFKPDIECYRVFVDFSKFMEHNRSKMKKNYYDAIGVPCETWEQQRWFPKGGKIDFYINFEWKGELVELPFDLEENLKDIYILDDKAIEAVANEVAERLSNRLTKAGNYSGAVSDADAARQMVIHQIKKLGRKDKQ